MGEGPVTDRQKTDKGFYDSYALVIAVLAAAILALVTATPPAAAVVDISHCDARYRACQGECKIEDSRCLVRCQDAYIDCAKEAAEKGMRPGTGGVPPAQQPPTDVPPRGPRPPAVPGQPPAQQPGGSTQPRPAPGGTRVAPGGTRAAPGGVMAAPLTQAECQRLRCSLVYDSNCPIVAQPGVGNTRQRCDCSGGGSGACIDEKNPD